MGTSKWPPWQPFGNPTSRWVLCTNNCCCNVPVACSGDVPVVFRPFGERPSEQFDSNNLPLFFHALLLVLHTEQVVYGTRDHPAGVWLGGDSPWVRRIIQILAAPEIGSLYNGAI